MDVAGDNQLNVEHEMVKQRVSRHGIPIGAAGVEIIGEVRKNYCIFVDLITAYVALYVLRTFAVTHFLFACFGMYRVRSKSRTTHQITAVTVSVPTRPRSAAATPAIS